MDLKEYIPELDLNNITLSKDHRVDLIPDYDVSRHMVKENLSECAKITRNAYYKINEYTDGKKRYCELFEVSTNSIITIDKFVLRTQYSDLRILNEGDVYKEGKKGETILNVESDFLNNIATDDRIKIYIDTWVNVDNVGLFLIQSIKKNVELGLE